MIVKGFNIKDYIFMLDRYICSTDSLRTF